MLWPKSSTSSIIDQPLLAQTPHHPGNLGSSWELLDMEHISISTMLICHPGKHSCQEPRHGSSDHLLSATGPVLARWRPPCTPGTSSLSTPTGGSTPPWSLALSSALLSPTSTIRRIKPIITQNTPIK